MSAEAGAGGPRTILEGGLHTDCDVHVSPHHLPLPGKEEIQAWFDSRVFWRTQRGRPWLYCWADLYWLLPALTRSGRFHAGEGETGQGQRGEGASAPAFSQPNEGDFWNPCLVLGDPGSAPLQPRPYLHPSRQLPAGGARAQRDQDSCGRARPQFWHPAFPRPLLGCGRFFRMCIDLTNVLRRQSKLLMPTVKIRLLSTLSDIIQERWAYLAQVAASCRPRAR